MYRPSPHPDHASFFPAGDLPSKDLRLRLRDGRCLRRRRHPADGTANAEGQRSSVLGWEQYGEELISDRRCCQIQYDS